MLRKSENKLGIALKLVCNHLVDFFSIYSIMKMGIEIVSTGLQVTAHRFHSR
jgi:hypothetical protein